MALYADPRNPLNTAVPDLSDIIDRFSEGQLDAATEEEESPYQGVADLTKSPMSDGPPIDPNGVITGRAAEFATPKDLADYAKNGSLATGDNGIGAFGDRTNGSTPFVAVPRDLLAAKYGSENAARGKSVEITSPNGTVAIVKIGDKGPALKNRANNAVIEVNPAAKRLLGSGDSNGYSYKLLD